MLPRQAPAAPTVEPATAGRRRGWLAAAVGLAGFAYVTADAVAGGPLARLAVPLDVWLARRQDPATAGFWHALSGLGAWKVAMMAAGASAVACLLLGQLRRALLVAGSAAVVGLLVTGLHVVLTPLNVTFPTNGPEAAWSRPDTATTPIPTSAGGATHLFPSGHTVGATFDFGLGFVAVRAWADAALLRPRVATKARRAAAAAWLAVTVSCAFARLAVRAHWYTDVLAALLLGVGLLGWVLALDTAMSVPRRRRPVAAPGL